MKKEGKILKKMEKSGRGYSDRFYNIVLIK